MALPNRELRRPLDGLSRDSVDDRERRPARPAGEAHFASLGLVAAALLLATGSIYRGALAELAACWLGA